MSHKTSQCKQIPTSNPGYVLPKKVSLCTTHHEACACHNFRYLKLESALQIIQTWASFFAENQGLVPFEKTLRDIESKAKEALNCLKT